MKRAIHQFFFKPYQDTQSLAFLRIGLALILFAQMLTLWSDFLTIYGQEGFIRGDVATAYTSPFQISSHHITALLSKLFDCSEMTALLGLRWGYLGLIVMLGLGLFTRLSSILVWLIHLALAKSAYYLSYGVDYMHTLLLFYCIFFPVGQQFSLDALWFSKNRKKTNPLPYLRLLQLHMCVIYLFGGLAKALGPNWWNGESIWKSVNRPMRSSFEFDWMADYSWLPLALGVSVLLIESLYAICIWIKPIRKYWLWSIIGMHLGIAIFLDLSFFGATMILMNLSAFYFFWRQEEGKHPGFKSSFGLRFNFPKLSLPFK